MIETVQEKNVQQAFSKQAAVFDEEDERNPILIWMRDEIRTSVLSRIKKNAAILELNCGTGLDAVFFAQQGFHVTATDNAPGMLKKVQEKKTRFNLNEEIDVLQCSFENLEQLGDKKFDHVFSNFGGLNCSQDLDAVVQKIKPLINPGGMATLVIMPPICLWELSLALKGNFKTAFRRLSKHGAQSHLEGITFTTWYYTPNYIKRSFGKGFTVRDLKALGIVVPPPYLYKTAIKYPRFFNFTKRIEKKIASLTLLRSFGDHFLITVQKIN